MKRRKIVALFVALLLSLVVAAGAAVAAGLYATSVLNVIDNITTPSGATYTVQEALVGSPDGKLAVWNPTSVGAAALDMGQQVCRPLYVYAPAPAEGISASGLVAVSKDPNDLDNPLAVASNFLHAADYADGRYVVTQFFPLSAYGVPDTTKPPYTGSFQGVYIINLGVGTNGNYGAVPLTVDAVEGSSCAKTLKGFYQPVDVSTTSEPVYNTVKGGSTVPLKFEIFSGDTEITDVSVVKSLTYVPTACDASPTTSEIETLASGGTSLRYDTTAGQFVYNWQTPKTPGCYRVTVSADDGSSLSAYFKLR